MHKKNRSPRLFFFGIAYSEVFSKFISRTCCHSNHLASLSSVFLLTKLVSKINEIINFIFPVFSSHSIVGAEQIRNVCVCVWMCKKRKLNTQKKIENSSLAIKIKFITALCRVALNNQLLDREEEDLIERNRWNIYVCVLYLHRSK